MHIVPRIIEVCVAFIKCMQHRLCNIDYAVSIRKWMIINILFEWIDRKSIERIRHDRCI